MGIQRQNICSSTKSCEMKLIVASLIGYLNAESLGRSRYARDADYEDALLESFPTPDDPRKLKQLLAQLKHYNGRDFDESRIRGYGCNCFMNDFGMENVSYGKPVNQLDSSCRAYQECLKCAKEEHGSHCFPDHTGYKMFTNSEEVICGNADSTCRRSLCECDKMFAKMQRDNAAVYETRYNVLEGWEPLDECVRGGKVLGSQPECCGGNGNPFVVYNTLVKQCCPNGKVALHGMCPEDEEEPETTPKPTTPETTTPVTVIPPGLYGKK